MKLHIAQYGLMNNYYDLCYKTGYTIFFQETAYSLSRFIREFSMDDR